VNGLPALARPIVQAPMAGGPSTPALAAAVCEAGGLGTLAAGYRSPDAVRQDIRSLREGTDRPFGMNLLIASPSEADPTALARYRRRLEPEAARYGTSLGDPRADDDHRAEKLAIAAEEGTEVVSFAFGCPTAAEVADLHAHGCAVWVTVTEPGEARIARRAGADVLVVQGVEAGGHRGSFEDADGAGEIALLPLLRLVADEVDLPLVAAGGIMDGAGVAAVLAAGAVGAQLGTAFLRCPEAGTNPAHREALATPAGTALTRAFSGRRARGLVNRFLREHSSDAPAAYPHLHHMTAPLRAAAREARDPDGFNLWAGQGYALGRELPAGELVRAIDEERREVGAGVSAPPAAAA
jgi:nitronate monooxygenase